MHRYLMLIALFAVGCGAGRVEVDAVIDEVNSGGKITDQRAGILSEVDGFHAKGSRLIPSSDEGLAKHGPARSEPVVSNPRYWNYFRVRGSDKIDVALFNYGQLLKIHGNGELSGFEVAGKDGVFKPATAKISSQMTEDGKFNVTWINLKSAQVEEPLYIRYAQGKYEMQANLINASGEKALPFQTLTP
ncbi:MAG: hypothetical protein VX776_07980 [Planctomycetota bacterium]|nr:hypothetical protein [Planctomycetota bacterium]